MRPLVPLTLLVTLSALPACHLDLRPATSPCKTSCGIRIVNAVDCPAFQAQEDRTIKAFLEVMETEFAPHEVCKRLENVTLYVHNPGGIGEWPWFEDEVGFRVKGLGLCRAQHIELGSDDWAVNSFSHEVAHLLESCAGGHGKDAHPKWKERGIYDAIEAARP